MKQNHLAIALMALLLSGCTANPQDAAPGVESQAAGNGNAGAGPSSVPAGAAVFTMQEVAGHDSKGDCWMVIDGKVLNLSAYTTHPGGDTFVPYCGKEATQGFSTLGGKGRNHSARAWEMIDGFVIGRIGGQ